jgi:hypothetical protein
MIQQQQQQQMGSMQQKQQRAAVGQETRRPTPTRMTMRLGLNHQQLLHKRRLYVPK